VSGESGFGVGAGPGRDVRSGPETDAGGGGVDDANPGTIDRSPAGAAADGQRWKPAHCASTAQGRTLAGAALSTQPTSADWGLPPGLPGGWRELER
jgi:hypothetical protein